MNMKNELARFFKHTILRKGETITAIHETPFSPNVRLAMVALVKKRPKKKDYVDDILHMKSQGMSFKNIAKMLDISPSYVSKLFKDATKDL